MALLAAAPAGAAPIDVEVRLEGGDRTIFDHTIAVEARTVRAPSDSEERTCDGTSGGAGAPAPTSVSVMVDAVDLIGEDWDGSWLPQFQNYVVDRIAEDTRTGNRFWGVLENDVFTGPPACSIRLDDGDAVLWAYDSFNNRPFMRLSGPSTATVDQPVELTASEFEPNNGATTGPYEGAEVSEVDAVGAPVVDGSVEAGASDASGAASVTFTEPGWHRVKARDAADSGDIDDGVASNSLDVCVEAVAGDGCQGDPLGERSLATPVNTTDPSITGTPKEGETLTADEGTWDPEPLGYSYQWRRCSAAGDDCSAINGADEREYVATSSDVGSTLRVEVTAEGALDSASELSDNTGVVEAALDPPVNTTPPAVRGPAQVGETLVAFEGEWSGEPNAYSYEWRRCDSQGASCQTIPGVDEDELVLTEDDAGSTIRVVVVASNEAGDSAPATSAASSEVIGEAVPRLRVQLVRATLGEGRRVTIRVRSSEEGRVDLRSRRLANAPSGEVVRGPNEIAASLTGAAAKRLRKRGRLPVRVSATVKAASDGRTAGDSEVLLLRR